MSIILTAYLARRQADPAHPVSRSVQSYSFRNLKKDIQTSYF